MATSGQFDGAGGYQGRTLQFAWTRTSYSLQGNYSDIYWEVRVVGGTSSYYYHYHEHAYINGQQIHGMDSRTRRYKGTVASGTKRFYHDSNGDCRFDVRLYAAVYTSSYNVDHTVTFYLDNLPRQANITSYPGSFSDEDDPWFDFTNPANWNMECWLEPNPSGEHYAVRTLSGTSGRYIWDLTDEERNQLRAACTDSNKCTVRIGLYSNSKTWASYKDATLNIVNADPLFNTPEYEITNHQDLVDSVTMIQGYSNVDVKIASAEPQKSATIKSYKAVIGDVIKTSETPVTFSFENIKESIIKCYVEDSRGNTVERIVNISNVITYTPPFISELFFERNQGGIGTGVDISFKGTMWAKDFVKESNTVSAQYFYKEQGAIDWIQGQTQLDLEYKSELELLQEIKGDLDANGFNNGKIYDAKVIISDRLDSFEKTGIIPTGIPTTAYHSDGFCVRGFYSELEGGSFQIEGLRQPVFRIRKEDENKNEIEYIIDENGKEYIFSGSIMFEDGSTLSDSKVWKDAGFHNGGGYANKTVEDIDKWSECLLMVSPNGLDDANRRVLCSAVIPKNMFAVGYSLQTEGRHQAYYNTDYRAGLDFISNTEVRLYCSGSALVRLYYR
ncbi:hypothetical protein H6A09_01355 [[Clostridium] spiroforme]|nr:hypothetical protein [Thomasclavelia spiroformis]